jgi:hypothetical protein
LAGARGGTVGATLRTRKRTVKPPPGGCATPRKVTPYLKEEKARFLFLEVPADAAVAAGAAADSPPTISAACGPRLAHGRLRRAHRRPVARTSAACAASVVDCLVAGASALATGDGTRATGAGSGDGVLTVKIRQPSHEFTFGVGMSFILYPLVLTPVV